MLRYQTMDGNFSVHINMLKILQIEHFFINFFSFSLLVNYPPLARAEVGASGLRPSFFLPTKNVELRSKSGNKPCCKAGELSILHRQAPVFHRLYLICRIFSEKSNFMRIFLQKKFTPISVNLKVAM